MWMDVARRFEYVANSMYAFRVGLDSYHGFQGGHHIGCVCACVRVCVCVHEIASRAGTILCVRVCVCVCACVREALCCPFTSASTTIVL